MLPHIVRTSLAHEVEEVSSPLMALAHNVWRFLVCFTAPEIPVCIHLAPEPSTEPCTWNVLGRNLLTECAAGPLSFRSWDSACVLVPGGIEWTYENLELSSLCQSIPVARQLCLSQCPYLLMSPGVPSLGPPSCRLLGPSVRVGFLLSRECDELSCASWVQSSVWVQSNS